jgi:hypothetical protein
MAALEAAIQGHEFDAFFLTLWMAGSSPAMTGVGGYRRVLLAL